MKQVICVSEKNRRTTRECATFQYILTHSRDEHETKVTNLSIMCKKKQQQYVIITNNFSHNKMPRTFGY